VRQKPLFFVFVVVAILAIGLVLFRSNPVSQFDGKPVTFWLDEMAAGGERSNIAVNVFLKNGAAAIPALTNELRFVPPLRTNFILLKSKLPWALASKLPKAAKLNWSRRLAAARALEQIGPPAKSAVPALIASVSIGDTEELMRQGQNGGMLVGQAWHYEVREAALDALARIDGQNPEVLATAALVAVGRSAQRPSRWTPPLISAMRVLDAAKNPDPKLIENFLKLFRLQDREIDYQKLSAFASRISPNRGIGLPLNELMSETNAIAALHSKNPDDREAAAFELGDPQREGASPPRLILDGADVSDRAARELFLALADPEEKVRINAAETLVLWEKVSTAENESHLVATLTALLDSTNSLIQLRAVENLRRLGSRAESARPALRRVASKPSGLAAAWARKTEAEFSSESESLTAKPNPSPISQQAQ
jgi:HEAT repeat protein